MNVTRKERIARKSEDLRKKTTRKFTGVAIAGVFGGSVLFGTTTTASACGALHVVSKGDTLYKIAKEHGTTVELLKIVNELESDTIQIGLELTVPEKPHTNPTKEVAEVKEPKPVKVVASNIYKVVAGDTLWGIAKRFGTTVENIKITNRMKGDYILIGQKLNIQQTTKTKAVVVGAVDNFTVEFKTQDGYLSLKVPYGTAQSYEEFSGNQVVLTYKNNAVVNVLAN